MFELAVHDALTLQDGELFHNRKGRVRPCPRPLAPLADTHGHLTDFSGHDPAVALARAALAGVRLLVVPIDAVGDIAKLWVTPAAFLSWLDEQIDLAHRCLDEAASRGVVPPDFDGYVVPDLLDNVHIVVGVHPYGAAEVNDSTFDNIEKLLQSPYAVGIGEIGLDYGSYAEVTPDMQKQVFKQQLKLAQTHGLPVELHIRDAADDLTAQAHTDAARILDEIGVPKAGCDMHCFTSGPEVMHEFVQRGCHIAFGGALTFKKSDDIRQAAVACPEHLILSETDCPYMSPEPLRGVEGEPALVAFTVQRLAELRAAQAGNEPQTTYDSLWNNACSFFSM